MGLREAIDLVNREIEKSKSNDNAAKLSTKKRNKLKKSQFCGPERSFPCNDCSHIIAAKRMLNRSKYSDATKAKIRACINRKSKEFNCGGKEKSKDVEALINSEVFKKTRDMVEESINNPGMDLDFPEDCC
jgi:hypothetical protein